MARRIIIGEILNLIKGLGGNPNKFMGTKTNINFLGKGPKESLFQGQIDVEGMMRSGFPIERVVTEAETAGGYVTAGKLNELQLQRLKDNLIQLKRAYKPEQIANITDITTRTGDLTQEGLGSLREGLKRFPEETHQFMGRPLKEADFAKIDQLVAEGKLPPAEGASPLMTRIQDRMKNIKGMSDEMGAIGKGDVGKAGTYTIVDPTAERASYASRFNPKNEVHVEKAKALLEDPQIKGVYTEAEVKNSYDFEGLYQSHFDKGQVDIARFFEMEGGRNIPQLRSAARDALLLLMKKENQAGAGLRNFVDEIDFKYITEGGGGRAGDPINLMAKYFGKNVTETLPKNPTKQNIDKFTDFIINSRDARGRGIDDPFFDRETIDFSKFAGYVDDLPPFESGGRVGFKYGSGRGVKSLMNLVNKKFGKGTLKKASDVAPSTKYEDIAAVTGFERREMIRNKYQGLIDDDLLNKILIDDNPQRIAEILATIDEMLLMQNVKGMGPESIMQTFRESWKRKKSASGGMAHILNMSDGGRTGFKYGSRTIAKGALAFLNKNKKNAEYMFKASDNVSPGYAAGDMKYNAELLADQLAEDAGVVYHDLDDLTRIKFYGTAYDYLSNQMANMLTHKRMLKDIGQQMQLSEFNIKGRKPNASGGLAKILEV